MCVAYAFVTEVGSPVWRATLMCAVYLGTRLLYRDRAMLNALGTAALALLIYDPRQLLTPSFQMTLVCVLIVAGVGIPLLERTSQLYKLALSNWDSNDFAAQLPPRVAQFRIDLQMISARLMPFIGANWADRLFRGTARFTFATMELIFVSAVMQMGSRPPLAYYFHRATTLGLPANLVVVPVVELMRYGETTSSPKSSCDPLGPIGPPASISKVRPWGVTSRVESPSPTSIEVTSRAPGRIRIFGCQKARATDVSKSTARPDAARNTRLREVQITKISDAHAKTISSVDGIATRRSASRKPPSPWTVPVMTARAAVVSIAGIVAAHGAIRPSAKAETAAGIYGPAAFPISMQSQLRTDTPTISVEWPLSSRIFGQKNSGSRCFRPARRSNM
jgi:hypothetical protein